MSIDSADLGRALLEGAFDDGYAAGKKAQRDALRKAIDSMWHTDKHPQYQTALEDISQYLDSMDKVNDNE